MAEYISEGKVLIKNTYHWLVIVYCGVEFILVKLKTEKNGAIFDYLKSPCFQNPLLMHFPCRLSAVHTNDNENRFH